MIQAFPCQDNLYRLYAPKSSTTYNIRSHLKECGATWDNINKQWLLTEEGLQKLKEKKVAAVTKMSKVVVEKHCHEEQREIFATEEEIKQGYVLIGCAMCDSLSCKEKVKIIRENA